MQRISDKEVAKEVIQAWGALVGDLRCYSVGFRLRCWTPDANAYMESLKGDSAIQRTDGYHLTFPKMKVPVTGSTPIVLQGLHLVSASLRLGMHGFCNENCLILFCESFSVGHECITV